jgi:hypothetical protein
VFECTSFGIFGEFCQGAGRVAGKGLLRELDLQERQRASLGQMERPHKTVDVPGLGCGAFLELGLKLLFDRDDERIPPSPLYPPTNCHKMRFSAGRSRPRDVRPQSFERFGQFQRGFDLVGL